MMVDVLTRKEITRYLRSVMNFMVMCGRTEDLEAHHIFSRGNAATRYDLANGLTLCSHHHKFDAKRAPHQNKEGFEKWLREHWFGSGMTELQFEVIRRYHKKVLKVSKSDLEDIYSELKNSYKELKLEVEDED